jgi:hypothetical protein
VITSPQSKRKKKRNGVFELIAMGERQLPLGSLGTDGSTILKRILEKQEPTTLSGPIWLRIGNSGCYCEHGSDFRTENNNSLRKIA